MSRNTSSRSLTDPSGLPAITLRRLSPFRSSGKNPKEPRRELSFHALGTDSFVGERRVSRRPDDKHELGDGGDEARVPGPVDQSQVPHSGRSGFYEWVRTGKVKQPYCFEVNDGELFALAGIWDHWTDPNSNIVETLLDSHHEPKCRHLSRSRPHASHS